MPSFPRAASPLIRLQHLARHIQAGAYGCLPPSLPPTPRVCPAGAAIPVLQQDWFHAQGGCTCRGLGPGHPQEVGESPSGKPTSGSALPAGVTPISWALWGQHAAFGEGRSCAQGSCGAEEAAQALPPPAGQAPFFATPSRERWVCPPTSPLMGHSSPPLVRMAPLKDWTAGFLLLVDSCLNLWLWLFSDSADPFSHWPGSLFWPECLCREQAVKPAGRAHPEGATLRSQGPLLTGMAGRRRFDLAFLMVGGKCAAWKAERSTGWPGEAAAESG